MHLHEVTVDVSQGKSTHGLHGQVSSPCPYSPPHTVEDREGGGGGGVGLGEEGNTRSGGGGRREGDRWRNRWARERLWNSTKSVITKGPVHLFTVVQAAEYMALMHDIQ